MKFILYRKRLSYKSGAGQLIAFHYDALKALGYQCQLYCQNKRWAFFLHSGILAKKVKKIAQIDRKTDDNIIIDHSGELLNADFTFVHNAGDSVRASLTGEDIATSNQAHPLLASQTHLIANSNFVKSLLIEEGFSPQRISVVYPSYNKKKFTLEHKSKYREAARKELAVKDGEFLFGFMTSGNFQKRGIDVFFEICEQMTDQNVKAFILGGDSLPPSYQNHPLIASGKIVYKPKSSKAEYWLSALDLFVYPAKFEEFGMVVPEALAMGIPVTTSQHVGASEILADEFKPYIFDKSCAEYFIPVINKLKNKDDVYQDLVKAAQLSIGYDQDSYTERSLAVIKQHTQKIKL